MDNFAPRKCLQPATVSPWHSSSLIQNFPFIHEVSAVFHLSKPVFYPFYRKIAQNINYYRHQEYDKDKNRFFFYFFLCFETEELISISIELSGHNKETHGEMEERCLLIELILLTGAGSPVLPNEPQDFTATSCSCILQ